MSIEIHEKFRSLIPPLQENERQELKENLSAYGCRDPLVVWGRLLLDGHHRYEICQKLGLEPPTVEVQLPNEDAAVEWIIRNQLGRRNLSDYQRAELALKLKPALAIQARQKSTANLKCGEAVTDDQNSDRREVDGRTLRKLANVAGVSHDTIHKVERVKSAAVKQVQELAREGRLSVDAAAQIAKLPPEEQEQLAAAGPGAVKGKVKQIRERKKKYSTADATTTLGDQLGNLLPDIPDLRQAFAHAHGFDRALALLRGVAEEINALVGDPGKDEDAVLGGEVLAANRQQTLADLNNLRSALNDTRPFTVCPYPRSPHGTCDACKGLGWVTKRIYDEAPAEYKAVASAGKGAKP